MSNHHPPTLDRPIPISQFHPFLLADATAKRSQVESIRRVLAVPSPAVDYWRLLRLQIAAHHLTASDPRPEPPDAVDPLDAAIELAGPDRERNYTTAVEQYRRFLGSRRIAWVDQPRRAMWLAGPVKLRVDPELHITINGEPHVAKLYLKAEPGLALNQRRANPLAWLLHTCHGHLGRPLVIDVLRGRAFGLTRHGQDHAAVLRAQGEAFASLWRAGAPPAQDQAAA